MATNPDELLAVARQAATDWIDAPSDSPEEWDAADQLVSRFRALDEHIKAGGPLPAEWAPPVPGWDVVIPAPDKTTAGQIITQVQSRYTWPCTAHERGDEWEVFVPFDIRQNAEIALGRLLKDLGYRGRMRYTTRLAAR
jgi:hypothetical protein